MPRYTYVCQDLATGEPLSDLPLACTGLPRTISSDASATFTLDIGDPRVQDLDVVSATAPGRVALFALRDDVPVWGGIIWGRSYQAATTTLTIQASTVESYYRHRYWMRQNYYFGVDQLPIAAEMLLGVWPSRALSTLWTRSNGSTVTSTNTSGVETDSDGTPVTVNVIPFGLDIAGYDWIEGSGTVGPGSGITRNLYYQRGKNIYDALIEMMSLDAGFEWTCDPVRHSDGSLGWTSRFGYSQLGRHEDVTGLEFDYAQGVYDSSGIYQPGLGSNIVDYQYSEDATPSADRVIVTGAEVNAYIPSFVRGDLRSLQAGYPLLEAGPSYSDVTDATLLQSRAGGDLLDAALPVALSTWTVLADGDDGFGSAQIGDRAVFAVSDLFTPRQTSGLEGRYSVERIVGWTLVPEQRGQPERWQLTTNPVTQPSARLPKSETRAWERVNRRLNGMGTVAAQGLSPTPIAFTSSPIAVPLPPASTVGSSVTVTDLTFTKTAAQINLSYQGRAVNNTTHVVFVNWSLFDIATGNVLDSFQSSHNANFYPPYNDRLVSLSDYDYGDRVALRVTAYVNNTYSTAIPGQCYIEVDQARQLN